MSAIPNKENKKNAKKFIKSVINPKSEFFYDIYDCVDDKNSVQSFFTYLTLHKINCTARNVFNVLLYFAENIKRFNKKNEVHMDILHACYDSNETEKNILDSWFYFEINPVFFYKNYCKINILEKNKKCIYKMFAELYKLTSINTLMIESLEKSSYSIGNDFISLIYTIPLTDNDLENIKNDLNSSLDIYRTIFNKYECKKIKIKIELNLFIEIFSSISYKTKQLHEFIKKNSY